MAASELLHLVPQAPQALRDILDGARGPVQPPIRSEIFGLQRFAQHGRSLGETHRAERPRAGAASFFPQLRNNIAILREAHRYIGLQAATGYDVSPAAEWLLDNFHLIEAQLEEIHAGLPRSYFRTLPVLLDEPLAGLPRVYGIAWAFVAHTDGAFDESLLAQFLSAYQETRELNLAEMWALPTTLRVLLVENLRRLAERVATNKAAREVANLCADNLESYSLPALDKLLALMNQRGVGRMFLSKLAQRLQDRRSHADARYHTWLQAALPDVAAVQTQHNADQAADNLSVSNAVKSLKAIGDADWPDIVARTSVLMQHLLTSKVFEAEHTLTRDQTLHGIERLARRSGHSEVAVAQILLGLMHSGSADNGSSVASHWLRGAGRPALVRALGLHENTAVLWRSFRRRAALPAYLGALALGTLGLVVWLLPHHTAAYADIPGWMLLLTAVLMAFPASEAVVAVINRLISESVRPEHLPRLGLVDGIPREHRVLVVVPAMLTDTASVQMLVRRLQLHHIANPEPHAQFALLTDWVDADTAHTPSDSVLLDTATELITELNQRYPNDHGMAPRFILLHRDRGFSETEQRWIGWERKRGKLEQLVEALATGSSTVFRFLGQLSQIAPGTPYIVTLDSDTQLPPGRLRELVGVAAHPHNQPRLDATGRCVVHGYGILQPRVATPLPARKDFTLYHWLFAGQCGIDPYSAATSEVYQDLFSEGTFTGKGLLNVRAAHAVLSGRLPEGQVLSHDLLEGSLARCAAVTDVTLIEDAPFHADVAASRVHRWTRGDWQLLPILLNFGRYPLRAINRWKMFDNLRRSLVAPVSLALLVLALCSSSLSPWAALALVAGAFSAGPLMGAVAGFAPSRDNLAKRHFYRIAGTDLARTAWGGLWHVAQLLMHALLHVDAIARALYRMRVSHRHLLQWTTAATAQAQALTQLPALVRAHWSLPVVGLLLLLAIWAAGTPHPLLAALLCLLWAASPVWIWWTSRTHQTREDAVLPAPEQARLDGIARDTWRWFERCISPDDNHLPPDNLQTLPVDILAHRTSPTNIGLYLLSVACARQFGWIGTHELLDRLEATLATLYRMQRHRGHFYNWYDTQTCAPLLPLYVSAVDSGNLSGHLLAVAQACLELAEAPHHSAAGLRALDNARQRLEPLLARRKTLDTAERETLRWMLADHRATRRSTQRDAVSHDPRICIERLQALAQALESLAWEADFGFLYHRKRNLLHIGFRVAEQQLDAGFYDLLASESRLTSLLAIAKGDVPMRHWSALGRPFYASGADAGLRSWSGSMFEYLMPTLVLVEPPGSVLQEASHAAVLEQIAYTKGRDLPWGISESAYAGQDHTLAYQYSPQGVPRLALRRTPADELVIAPYATALAAQVSPRASMANFAALGALGAHGRYGFIEALDFTPARQSDGEAFTPVSTFMAHHQGMSLVALANLLLDGPAQRWGMANAHIEAVASLLHERAPREISQLNVPLAAPPAPSAPSRSPGLLREVLPASTVVAPTHLLSNGRYHVALRANGAGWSRWGTTGITRGRDDALRDAYGSFFYLRWAGNPQPVSITQHPAPDPAADYQSTYHADRVCFDAAWPEVQAHTTVWVSPEDDIEFRLVELRNLGDTPLDIELLSAFEITLADPRADEAHPAFSNLFVRAVWQEAQQALLFERRPRLPTEKGMQAAHFLADTSAQIVDLRIQTDRQRWLGRNQTSSQPLASFDAVPASGAQLDTGLDPVCALAVRLRIAPHGRARLTFATAASDHSPTLQAVIDKYRQYSHIKRSSLMSATLANIRLRTLGLGPDHLALVQTLTTALVLSLARPQTYAARGAIAEVSDRRLLWRFGISGERPILLVTASAMEGMGLLRALGRALRLWSWGGVGCDLVVINAEPSSYEMALQREIGMLRDRHAADRGSESSPTNIYLLRSDELTPDELSTLQAQARIRLRADGRPLLYHVQAWTALHEQASEERHNTSTRSVPLLPAPRAIPAAPTGDFQSDGEFRFDISPQLRTTRPWSNVLANPGFGAHITEAGGGYSWALNSRLNQLTAWSNDPVADTPSEWFLLQDLKTLKIWSVAPSAWGDALAVYHVAHGQGHSSIRHRRGDVDVAVSWCVDAETSVKQIRVHIINRGERSLQLRIIGIAEWMMGANRSDRSTVHTAVHQQKQFTALLCTQRERSAGFGEGTAFLALAGSAGASEAADDWTCDRRECFDARGRLVVPDHFGHNAGAGLDPCAALSTRIELEAGNAAERVFLLGYAENPLIAQQLLAQIATVPAAQRLDKVQQNWDQLLGATRVATPDPLFDAMVNRWLLYQTVSCRLWAKSGFYQAGGATGFRDQLQDAMALAWAAPAILRQQIVVCASRQFPEGDVQHWWHAPNGAGVRTHFSDDLLWLPYACVHYLRSTDDHALLDEPVNFLEGSAIPAGAEDAYYTPSINPFEASVYEHAARSIDRSLAVGAHGLPLMGSGDWNDGMNRVGIEGRGESVWLGWFLCRLVADFAPIATVRGDTARALAWQHAAEGWKQALLGPAWDGQWFKRAFFDDGQALGSHANPEAQIDLIAQAWAVLSRTAPPALQRMALTAVDAHLVDTKAGLIKLLDPPLAQAVPSAGYIQAYPPGVRENGGQYSHAGVWAMMAQAEFARHQPDPAQGADTAYRYFTYLNPAHRARNPAHSAAYGIEPYVMAGDVYSQPPYVGRGGWSWYTGSAAWMHRAAIESIFGLQQSARELCFCPCLPSHWSRAELTLRRGERSMRFILLRATAEAALATAAAENAQILRPGQPLDWPELAAQSCFVIALLEPSHEKFH